MKFNDPTPHYTTQPNGDVTVEWLPPTALMQTAQRELEKMAEVIGGQTRTMQTMQEHINYLEHHINNLQNHINELTSPKPTNGCTEHTSSAGSTGTSTGESQTA